MRLRSAEWLPVAGAVYCENPAVTARLPAPLLLFYVTASEVANDYDRVVIIVGLADRRRALVNEFSGPASIV